MQQSINTCTVQAVHLVLHGFRYWHWLVIAHKRTIRWQVANIDWIHACFGYILRPSITYVLQVTFPSKSRYLVITRAVEQAHFFLVKYLSRIKKNHFPRCLFLVPNLRNFGIHSYMFPFWLAVLILTSPASVYHLFILSSFPTTIIYP